MKVIEMAETGGPEVLRQAEHPRPDVPPGWVRIKIEAAGLNPVDVKLRRGMYPVPLPRVPGYDAAGTIDAVGDGVTAFAPGDPVWTLIAGACSNGAYAEFTALPAQFVARRPDGLSAVQAAALPVIALTAQLCLDQSGLEKGDALFVAGAAGGVGTMLVQIARARGAGRIVATAGGEASREKLRRLGLAEEDIIDYRGKTGAQVAEEALAHHDGRGFARTFDLYGGEMKPACLDALDYFGHMVTIVGEAGEVATPIWHGRQSPLFQKNASLSMVLLLALASSPDPAHWEVFGRDLDRLSEMLAAGQLEPPEIETIDGLDPAAVGAAQERVWNGRTPGKAVVRIAG
ncbi:MAG: NADP-dependent oxidoreductase [Verrucomicrobiota bacterium]